MENVIKQIPFVLNNKNGILEVCYKKNTDIYESGFDLLTGLGFDINMCLGYPTIHGYFKEFEGTGYNRVCAWIQVITQKYFSSPEHSIPCKVSSTVDTYNKSLVKGTATGLSVARSVHVSGSNGAYALFAGGSNSDMDTKTTVDAYNNSLARSTPTGLSEEKAEFNIFVDPLAAQEVFEQLEVYMVGLDATHASAIGYEEFDELIEICGRSEKNWFLKHIAEFSKINSMEYGQDNKRKNI